MLKKKLINQILEIAWHRNGVGGRGFYAVRFTSDIDAVDERTAKTWNIPPGDGMKNAQFLAVVTDTPGECYVICTDLLATCGVKFAGGNSWRGDHYEPELRAAIDATNNVTSGAARVGPFGLPTE